MSPNAISVFLHSRLQLFFTSLETPFFFFQENSSLVFLVGEQWFLKPLSDNSCFIGCYISFHRRSVFISLVSNNKCFLFLRRKQLFLFSTDNICFLFITRTQLVLIFIKYLLIRPQIIHFSYLSPEKKIFTLKTAISISLYRTTVFPFLLR